MDTKINLAFS